MDGSISNRDYEQRYPRAKDDPALSAIYTNIWFCYPDIKDHALTGKYALSDEQRALLRRCVLFLRSDFEFQWPPPKFGLKYGILRLLGFKRFVKRWGAEDMSIGDVDAWPFLRRNGLANVERIAPQTSARS
ncbi:MAG: hypothetical protein WA876_16240 [Candidatus Acidiferrales bacterium]